MWYTNWALMIVLEGALIYFVIVHFLSKKEYLRWFIWAVIAVGSGMIIRIWQLGGWEASLQGLENNQVSKIFLPIFALAIFAYFAEKDIKLKIISVFTSMIFLHTLINLLGSRASYLSLIPLILLAGLVKFNRSYTWLAGFVVIVFLATHLATIVPTEFNSIQYIQEGEAAPTEQAGSVADRARILENGMQMFQENIIFGVGIGTFVNKYTERFGIVKNVHNSYVEMGTETGFLGLFFYSIILIISLFYASKAAINFKRKGEINLFNFSLGLGIGLIAFIINMLFINHPVEHIFWIMVGICTALYTLSRRIGNEEVEQKPKERPKLVDKPITSKASTTRASSELPKHRQPAPN